MITYRVATKADQDAIAQIHAKSWQENYRGSFPDEYLDNEVLADRMAVWSKRFSNASHKQYILVAEENNELCGFVCLYLHDDSKWGSLLDNLHVVSSHKGRGIGKALTLQVIDWARQQVPKAGVYLWVLTDNAHAIQFYERLGGKNVEQSFHEMPGGGTTAVYRYVWS